MLGRDRSHYVFVSVDVRTEKGGSSFKIKISITTCNYPGLYAL